MIDLKELELELYKMSRRSELYKVVKRVLSDRGYWKSLPRGNPKKGFEATNKRG